MYITRKPCDECQELMRVDYVGRAIFLVPPKKWYSPTTYEYLDLTPWKGM